MNLIKKSSSIFLVLIFAFGFFDFSGFANAVGSQKNKIEKYIIQPDIKKAELKLSKEINRKKKIQRLRKTDKYFITGYQLVQKQTDSTPYIAAWNDNIKGALNVVAVVQDSPLRRGTCVKIAGLSETYIVLDRFNKRYNGMKKFDVLVSSKAEAHRITGRRKVEILPAGNCVLKRMVNGVVREEKYSRKKRFKY